jgi:hypothetical protein
MCCKKACCGTLLFPVQAKKQLTVARLLLSAGYTVELLVYSIAGIVQ